MKQRNGRKPTKPIRAKTQSNAGAIAFVIALIMVLFGAVQFFSTFHTYAMNLAQLESLKRQESSLTTQKQELENDISRWNDKSYVIAQARERLGFIFEGETALKVEHPEAVTGKSVDSDDSTDTTVSPQSKLPWYSELAYSLHEADRNKGASSENTEQTPAEPTEPSSESSTSSVSPDGTN